MSWRETLHAVAAELEEHADRFRARQGGQRQVVIVPYRGFGRGNELVLRGRVLLEKAITRVTEAEPVWRNLLNVYRRFETDEVPAAKVRASYRDAVVETLSNEEGHFLLRLQPAVLDEQKLWHEVLLQLPEHEAQPAKCEVIIPPPQAQFGVISDIDDTIVHTGATRFRDMIRSVLLHNAATRTPFPGVAQLYEALHRHQNPIFYVSSGPWNLYDLLVDYMEFNAIPHGPIFLQDYGLDRSTFVHQPHDVHKLREIQSILDYYPHLPFLLIGDSGQHDPEIYLKVAQSNRERVRGVIIRDVTGDERDKGVAALAESAAAAGVEMAYVPDSAAALEYARRWGLLDEGEGAPPPGSPL